MEIVNTQLIKKWEQLRLEAYLPTPNDVWTIGWGHTHGVKKGDSISTDEAEAFFYLDTKWVRKTIDDLVKVGLSQHQYDALASLIFNIGRTNFSTSTLLRKLNAGDYEGAANEFPRWNKQKGTVLNGLVRRRAEEMAYFLVADVTGPASASVDPVQPLPHLTLSKEVVAGSTAIVTALGGFMGKLNDISQYISVGTISAVLAMFGAFIIYNRISARHKGER